MTVTAAKVRQITAEVNIMLRWCTGGVKARAAFMGITSCVICLTHPSDSASHSADVLDQLKLRKLWRLSSVLKL